MANSLRQTTLLALLCGVVFFFNLGAARLFDEDEPKNAECGREMLERGDWLVPTYNYELRTDKPIMLYWLMLSSYETFGVSEFSARLPSAIMATLTIFCVYLIGRRLFEPQVGFWSAVILASCLMYVTAGRISTPDSTLIGFVSLALLIYVSMVPRSSAGWSISEPAAEKRLADSLPSHWWQFALLYGVMGLAVLTKGPVGFLLPCAVIGLFLLCQRDCPHLPEKLSWKQPLESINELVLFLAAFWTPSRFFSALWSMRPWTLFFVVCAVSLPWYVAVSVATDGEWINGFLGNHNLGRFSSAMEGHKGPFFYYVVAILAGFFPWSVFLPIIVYLAATQKSAFPRERRGLMFLLCWLGVYVGFFSLAQTKLPNYVLPCYPALALLTGWGLVRWQKQQLELPGWAILWSSRSLVVVGLLLGIGLPVFSWLQLPGYAGLGVLGLFPLLCGLWMMGQKNETCREHLLGVMGICALLLVGTAFSLATPWISQSQESYLLGARAAECSESTTPLATYRYFTTNLPFYAARPVARYHQPAEIQAYFERHPRGLLCVREQDWEQIAADLPDSIKLIEQKARFLRTENVLLLQNTVPQTATVSETRILR